MDNKSNFNFFAPPPSLPNISSNGKDTKKMQSHFQEEKKPSEIAWTITKYPLKSATKNISPSNIETKSDNLKKENERNSEISCRSNISFLLSNNNDSNDIEKQILPSSTNTLIVEPQQGRVVNEVSIKPKAESTSDQISENHLKQSPKKEEENIQIEDSVNSSLVIDESNSDLDLEVDNKQSRSASESETDKEEDNDSILEQKKILAELRSSFFQEKEQKVKDEKKQNPNEKKRKRKKKKKKSKSKKRNNEEFVQKKLQTLKDKIKALQKKLYLRDQPKTKYKETDVLYKHKQPLKSEFLEANTSSESILEQKETVKSPGMEDTTLTSSTNLKKRDSSWLYSSDVDTIFFHDSQETSSSQSEPKIEGSKNLPSQKKFKPNPIEKKNIESPICRFYLLHSCKKVNRLH